MSITAAGGAKHGAPPAVAVMGEAVHGDLPPTIILVCVGIGLTAGAMWRASKLRSEGSGWRDGAIQRDLAVSLLAGLANGILALLIVAYMDGGVLIALGVGMLVGATGVRAIQWATKALEGFVQRQMALRKLGEQAEKETPDGD
jgi:hypothetical protein